IPHAVTMLQSSRHVGKPAIRAVAFEYTGDGNAPLKGSLVPLTVHVRSPEKGIRILLSPLVSPEARAFACLKRLCFGAHRKEETRVYVVYRSKLPTIKSESRLKHLLQRLPSYCPESMVSSDHTLYALMFGVSELWICINSTLPGASRKSDSWVGLGCCELAISVDCRRECKLASSKNDITKVCKKDSEKPLYSCISKNEMGSGCCSYAGRHTNCREYCQAIFRTDSSPSVSQIKTLKEYCQSISPQLISCVGNYTKSYPIKSPVDSLFCCDRAEDAHCQSACRRILRTLTTEQEIIDALISECDRQPLPQDPLWQCFLGSAHSPRISDPDPPSTGRTDCAKLHCCSKANTSLCREMCQEISTNWGSQTWQEFDQLCEYNPVEADLVTCLADVREPCQLGCKDLTYCTNFNNRPTELFRSCNTQSDQGAMNDIKLWSNGTIRMPFMNIPVLDIRKCRPEMWKAVACALQIKPCYSKSRGSIICRSDCVDILTQCGDRRRFQEGQTPERICDLLSPTDDPERCIPLERYLRPSLLGGVMEEVIHPCNPNPCLSNQLCEVNRKGCQPGQDCLPYLCVPGCKLCEASEFLSGRLESCSEMPCVDTSKTCTVGAQRRNHGTSFMMGCQLCSCFSGDVLCSKRQCLTADSSEEEHRRFTGLPCGCADQFVPVCAQNGRTYPSACVARCMGLHDNQFGFGSCRDRDPCSRNPCPKGQRCVPNRRVCLTSFAEYPCKQYDCLSNSFTCDKSQLDPVCDTAGVEHANLCLLYQRGKTPAYMGHCQKKKTPPLPRHDLTSLPPFSVDPLFGPPGFQMSSALSSALSSAPPAWSLCSRSRGLVSARSDTAAAPLFVPEPASITLKANNLNLRAASCPPRLNHNLPVTIHDILRILRLHVSVPQCDVFGYLSIDSEIVVLVVPVDQQPTPLQIEACSKEAEKIDSLINYGSPTLMSHVPASAFLASEVNVSTLSSSGLPARGAVSHHLVLGLLLTVILTLGTA
ncbi:reversion-inducing cysteine-rich protein with Kazal motifs-like, partial [Scleropages formosus]